VVELVGSIMQPFAPATAIIDRGLEIVNETSCMRMTIKMNAYIAVGAVCVIAWGLIVYALAIGSGWVHALVALGFVLIARGLIAVRAR
jgi:hypothetical protein